MAKVNKSQLSEVLGVSTVTVDKYQRDGLPYVQRGENGKRWVFDTRDCIAWLKAEAVKKATGQFGTAKGGDVTELKRRKLEAETIKAEIEAMTASNQVLDIDSVVKICSDHVFACKARLFNIHLRVAPQIVGETDESRIKDIIKEEITYCCDELSNRFVGIEDDLPPQITSSKSNSVGASTETETESVGRSEH